MSEATFAIRAMVSNALGIGFLWIMSKLFTPLNGVLFLVAGMIGVLLYWGSKEAVGNGVEEKIHLISKPLEFFSSCHSKRIEK